MLKHLYIKNFTLIDQLDIDFHPGFSVITGETGAGKSIILGAIGLLLGNRADSKLVKRPQGDDGRTVKCTIEAHFDLSRYDFAPFFEENDLDFDPDDTIIRRELTSTGKSRSFINDMPVSQQLMRQLGEQLIDIHSQHQNLLLQKDDFQLNVVDIIADNGQDRAAFSEAFTRYREAEQRLRSLEKQIEASEQNRDFLQFQYNELSAAQLVEGEQEQLEQEGETLNHAGDIKTAIYTADNLLSGDDRGAVMQVRMAAQQLQSIASVYPKTQELANRLDSVHIELDDIAHEVAADMESIDFDPSRQDAIIARLDQIYSLQQKYRVSTVAELLQLQASIQQQLESIENADGDLASCARRWPSRRSYAGRRLSSLRYRARPRLARWRPRCTHASFRWAFPTYASRWRSSRLRSLPVAPTMSSSSSPPTVARHCSPSPKWLRVARSRA